MIFVSPAEPPVIKLALESDADAVVSPVAERHGSDFYILPGRAAIQRKEIADLIASIINGRLAEELEKMRGSRWRMLVVEGHGRWTIDGQYVSKHGEIRRFTKAQFWGLLASVQESGVWVFHTADHTDTVHLVGEIEAWVSKARHVSLLRRPNVQGEWGTASREEFLAWVNQAIPGCGPVQAMAMVRAGVHPVWPAELTVEQLAEVAWDTGKGTRRLGIKAAKRYLAALRSEGEEEISHGSER